MPTASCTFVDEFGLRHTFHHLGWRTFSCIPQTPGVFILTRKTGMTHEVVKVGRADADLKKTIFGELGFGDASFRRDLRESRVPTDVFFAHTVPSELRRARVAYYEGLVCYLFPAARCGRLFDRLAEMGRTRFGRIARFQVGADHLISRLRKDEHDALVPAALQVRLAKAA